MITDDVIAPTPYQHTVLELPEEANVLLAGGRGGGKTYAVLFLVLRHVEQYGENARPLILRETHKALTEIEDKLRWFVRSQEGFLRAVYSVANDAWDDPAHGETEGWSYKGVLAHVASNEERLQIRFRSAAGNASQAEIDAVNDVEAWNRDKVSGLTASTPSQLVDAFLKGRNETIEVLAAYERSALDGSVTVAGGESVPLLDFIDRVSNHTSWHAAQLVPASSRARLAGDR